MIVSAHPKRSKSVQYAILLLYIGFLGFPLLWMLSVSFKGPRELVELYPSLIPSHPTFANYGDAVHEADLVRSAVNSLKVAVITAVLTTFSGAIGVR